MDNNDDEDDDDEDDDDEVDDDSRKWSQIETRPILQHEYASHLSVMTIARGLSSPEIKTSCLRGDTLISSEEMLPMSESVQYSLPLCSVMPSMTWLMR